MTTDSTQGLNDLSLPSDTFLDAADTFTEPSGEWIDTHLLRKVIKHLETTQPQCAANSTQWSNRSLNPR